MVGEQTDTVFKVFDPWCKGSQVQLSVEPKNVFPSLLAPLVNYHYAKNKLKAFWNKLKVAFKFEFIYFSHPVVDLIKMDYLYGLYGKNYVYRRDNKEGPVIGECDLCLITVLS